MLALPRVRPSGAVGVRALALALTHGADDGAMCGALGIPAAKAIRLPQASALIFGVCATMRPMSGEASPKDDVPFPDATETRAKLLGRAKRDHVPIRRAFVQELSGTGCGPLAHFVRERRALALQLWLLLHASASGGDFDTRLHSRVWARALGLAENRHTASLISRNWSWLEQQRLVSKQRDHRLLNVTLLAEDGSGKPYSHPGRSGNYFKLPHAFWLDGWCDIFDLPTTAALLILLSRRPGTVLPQERAPEWYGISADTLGRGLKGLREHDLVRVTVIKKQEPLSPVGYTWEQRYNLLPPFARLTLVGKKKAA